MTSRLGFVLMLLGVLFGSARESYAQAEGILLGMRYETPITRPLPYYAGSADSLVRPAYRTLLITRDDSAFSIQTAAEHLLVPRGRSFWRVGTKRSIYNSWVEDFVWAAPEGAVPRLAGIQPFNGEYCEGHRTQAVFYAGPRYLALNQRSAGYCEGAAHPWFFNTLAVVPIDSTNHIGLGIDEVLGTAGFRGFEESAAAYLGRLDATNRARYVDVPDPANWSLVRRQGRWVAIGRLEGADEADRSLFADLALPLALPPEFNPPTPADWRAITAFAPDALDALVAPSGAWLVLLRPNRLTIHFRSGTRLGPAVLTRRLPPGAQVVMTRWNTGSGLATWRQYFDRLTAF